MKIRKYVMMLVVILTIAFSLQVFAEPSLTDVQKQQQELQKKLSAINSEKKETKEELITNKAKRAEIVKNLEEKGFEKNAIEEKLVQIDSAIKTLEDAIRLSEKEYADELALFQERIVVMYQRSKVWQGIDLVLDSKNISDLYKNRNAMKSVSKADQDMMASLTEKKEEIELLKSQKLEEEQTTEAQLQEKLKTMDNLLASRSMVDEEIEVTKDSIKKLEQQEDEINAESDKVSALIKAIKSSNVKYVGGDMMWPAPGNYRVSSPYGNRMHPIFRVYRFHSGIDIHADKGDTIAAANSGTVIYAGVRTGYGNTVIIDHGGGVTTLYAHIMNRGILVKNGQSVDAGQAIAKVGSTGWSTGPHLHFEYRKNGDTEDPLKHLGTRQ